ncbi:MAG TPA: hypothetical protein VHY20_06660, partial [Pirellulales bacterium]|nr:hypothetical protein [Pirellulales bacterium]
MKDFTLALAATALTALSWGVYGPIMQAGVRGMGGSHLLPFIAVGVAYFLIAVLAAGAVLATRGERGKWTVTGVAWSLAAGIGTAVGALGIILALKYGGSAVYVMPLVFGCAPVVNTFVTMGMSKSYKQAQPLFYAGLILVIAGAVTVLVFKPTPTKPAAAATHGALAPGAAKTPAAEAPPAAGAAHAEKASPSTLASMENKITGTAKVTLFILMTAICWGAYGPVLHKGQVVMGGSRLRPFICVGIAYFLVAVLAPLPLLGSDHGAFTMSGGLWSLACGAVGAIGSLGIILAFNYGGKPIFVMPLVFGGAPVVNTLTSIATSWPNLGTIHPIF